MMAGRTCWGLVVASSVLCHECPARLDQQSETGVADLPVLANLAASFCLVILCIYTSDHSSEAG